jgi:hypothetical protein
VSSVKKSGRRDQRDAERFQEIMALEKGGNHHARAGQNCGT